MSTIEQIDPIENAHKRMQSMNKEDLIKLVLIAANRIGITMHGESNDPIEATAIFVNGVEILFTVYDTAIFNALSNQGPTWGAHYA